MAITTTTTEAGIKKSAILLMSLGEDHAAAVFQHLDTEDVQKVGLAMTRLHNLTRDQIADVLDEFRLETEQFSSITLDSDAYLRAVLDKAVGSDRASGLFESITESMRKNHKVNGIETLNMLETLEISELIRDEHPQIIATLLIHLDRPKASAVLEVFDERLRQDVMMRIATFGGIQPEALEELMEVLSNLLSGQGIKRNRLGGVRAAAEMLNLMSGTQEQNVIDHVRNQDADLAQRIIDEMFLFENLMDIEDRGIQLLLKDVESETLIIALKGVKLELREKFLRNMSQRAAEILREDLENRGPVRLSQVEAEQKKILQIVRGLADAGQLTLGASKDEQFV
ncbi:flagellar motor switch protein FliG [Glaciimonas soli]|uniref:Flagellar motor switch protein FliG n=1 Tax=Glaciimonas soli TaxID=2590999 RepID=A0A843YNT8_9BURK|nr:flagellar motor switch protein FliG [Glaciimonas soli]MQQ99443.1 flagellar motor switch protein FliG [Glaciimonas soli]